MELTIRELDEGRFENSGEEMEGQVTNDWTLFFCNQPPVDLDKSANHHVFHSKLKSSSIRPEGFSEPYHSIWTDTEPARGKSCSSRSLATDARIRLNHLKSGSKSPPPWRVMDGTINRFNCQKERRERESQDVKSVLDLVELLEVEDDVEDEERW